MTFWLHAAALALSLLAAPAQAQQDAAVIKRATDLREGPAQTSASLGALAADSSVSRTGERKGSWVKVQTPQGAAGWVHMFDLGAQAGSAPASGSATSGLRSLGGLFGGSGSTTTATSTVGIRGLGAEDIANAQPNPAAVKDAEKLRVSSEQAQRFASASALRAQRVDPLPEPPRPASGGSQFTTDNMSPN
ncbi:MAG TPA: SH3 domain-containing protein [Giesbergeria sp.]|nr:SH3 domain-containing protein [Giesbergeria sp.]HRA14515.1 SH3 domain-containing protein [Giesbergeria sp.]